jgi:hypothetical protein
MREGGSAPCLLIYQGVEPEELAGKGGEKGTEGNRSPTFREGKLYPPGVVLPLLQRVFSKLKGRFRHESAKISFFFQVISSQMQI